MFLWSGSCESVCWVLLQGPLELRTDDSAASRKPTCTIHDGDLNRSEVNSNPSRKSVAAAGCPTHPRDLGTGFLEFVAA